MKYANESTRRKVDPFRVLSPYGGRIRDYLWDSHALPNEVQEYLDDFHDRDWGEFEPYVPAEVSNEQVFQEWNLLPCQEDGTKYRPDFTEEEKPFIQLWLNPSEGETEEDTIEKMKYLYDFHCRDWGEFEPDVYAEVSNEQIFQTWALWESQIYNMEYWSDLAAEERLSQDVSHLWMTPEEDESEKDTLDQIGDLIDGSYVPVGSIQEKFMFFVLDALNKGMAYSFKNLRILMERFNLLHLCTPSKEEDPVYYARCNRTLLLAEKRREQKQKAKLKRIKRARPAILDEDGSIIVESGNLGDQWYSAKLTLMEIDFIEMLSDSHVPRIPLLKKECQEIVRKYNYDVKLSLHYGCYSKTGSYIEPYWCFKDILRPKRINPFKDFVPVESFVKEAQRKPIFVNQTARVSERKRKLRMGNLSTKARAMHSHTMKVLHGPEPKIMPAKRFPYL